MILAATPRVVLTGIELRRLRLSRGLTQEQAAEILGVSRSMVANYERGWNPVPARLAPAVQEIARLPEREDPRLLAYAEHTARRARQHNLVAHVCSVCEREFRGPHWRKTCSARCLRRSSSAGRRASRTRKPGERLRRMLLDAMSGLFTIQELADAHGYAYATVQTSLQHFGVRIPRLERPGLLTERQARIASLWLDGATMQGIAIELRTSRESIRQTLKRCGMTEQRRRKAVRVVSNHRKLVRRARSPAATLTPAALRQTMREAEGRALREARLTAELTEHELGEVLGVDWQTISNWESGQWPLTEPAREWMSRIDTAASGW
jgi:transcriptional regulator with XRE-family HTH domain